MKGCVLNLKMRDKQGSVVTDYSRYGNDGAVNGGVVWTEQGMRFDGSSGYLDCGNNASLNPRKAITVSSFIYIDSIISDGGIVGRWEVDKRAYILKTESVGNKFKFATNDGGVYAISESVDNTAVTDTWIHVAGVYNGTNLRIYVNGVQSGNIPTSNAIAVTTSHVAVGCASSTSDQFDGSIDQVRIYNYALHPREIKAMYNTEKHNYV